MGGTLRPGATAKMLGVSISTLKRWRETGVGPEFYTLYGPERNAYRYKRSDVMRFLGETSRKTPAAPQRETTMKKTRSLELLIPEHRIIGQASEKQRLVREDCTALMSDNFFGRGYHKENRATPILREFFRGVDDPAEAVMNILFELAIFIEAARQEGNTRRMRKCSTPTSL